EASALAANVAASQLESRGSVLSRWPLSKRRAAALKNARPRPMHFATGEPSVSRARSAKRTRTLARATKVGGVSLRRFRQENKGCEALGTRKARHVDCTTMVRFRRAYPHDASPRIGERGARNHTAAVSRRFPAYSLWRTQ